MTAAKHATGAPVYSIRRYGRFGAFFEPDLEEGTPLAFDFRIVVSDHTLGAAECEGLYRDYVDS